MPGLRGVLISGLCISGALALAGLGLTGYGVFRLVRRAVELTRQDRQPQPATTRHAL